MAAQRPNIVILFTDMQRADTIRALGNPDARLIFQDYPSYPLDLPGYPTAGIGEIPKAGA